MEAAQQLISSRPIDLVCQALSIGRASFYRFLSSGPTSPTSGAGDGCRPTLGRTLDAKDRNTRGSGDGTLRRPGSGGSPRKITACERQAVLAELHSERFQDKAPAQVWATLLDEGRYLCSISSMYRLLHECDEVRERRKQRARTAYARPELLATGPNQVWSWDINKLRGPAKWT